MLATFLSQIVTWTDNDLEKLYVWGKSLQSNLPKLPNDGSLDLGADVELTHLRIERTGAPGHRTPDKAADLSTAAAQDRLRSLLWEDLITYLKEGSHDQPMIEKLERLRVA